MQLDFDKQRQEYAMEAAHIKAAKLQAEENQRQVNLVKQEFTYLRKKQLNHRSRSGYEDQDEEEQLSRRGSGQGAAEQEHKIVMRRSRSGEGDQDVEQKARASYNPQHDFQRECCVRHRISYDEERQEPRKLCRGQEGRMIFGCCSEGSERWMIFRCCSQGGRAG
eukprot:scaffold40092_cov18-Tisochrysis_lutea.AAC.1